MPKVHEVLNAMIREQGTNTSRLAKQTKMSRNTVARALAGQPSRKSTIEDLARALGTTRMQIEARAAGPEPMDDATRTERLRRLGLVRISPALPSQVWVNYQIVSQRYGVPIQTLLDAAPVIFALVAEHSLARRRARVDAIAEALEALGPYSARSLEHLNDFRGGRRRIEEALGAEQTSIARRNLDGIHANPDEDDEVPTLFADYLNQMAEEAGAAEHFDFDGAVNTMFGYCPVFEDDWQGVTGSDARAAFALHRRYVMLRDVPDELAWTADEPAERRDARMAFLAARVPDETWAEHLAELEAI